MFTLGLEDDLSSCLVEFISTTRLNRSSIYIPFLPWCCKSWCRGEEWIPYTDRTRDQIWDGHYSLSSLAHPIFRKGGLHPFWVWNTPTRSISNAGDGALLLPKVQLGRAGEWLYVQYIVQSSIRHVLMIPCLVILFLSCWIFVES